MPQWRFWCGIGGGIRQNSLRLKKALGLLAKSTTSLKIHQLAKSQLAKSQLVKLNMITLPFVANVF
jgi:hypothetical protein